MQFGGTPMVPSPSSTGVTTAGPLLSIAAPDTAHEQHNLSNTTNASNHNHSELTGSSIGDAQMFSPHANVANHQSPSMSQNNGNGQMTNETNHYRVDYPRHQQQGQPQQANGSPNNASSSAALNGTNTAQLIYPALHLQPLNDTFAPKQISLSPPGPQHKVKIGRQTNQKTVPQPSNGYFDSKVLSRAHAEIWSQDGKIFIKDVKSSNGTFINGSRLSPEGQESDSFELHTDDIVEFGIDIVGEDNKTIIHHKVACRAFLVMTAEEALGLRHDFAALYRGGIAGSTLNHHAVGPGAEGGLRRSKVGGNGNGGYGGTGSLMSFDHILHKLQAELQKSRDTAGELGNLNNAMHDIGETLGGGLAPMQNPPYQHLVPPVNGERDGQSHAAEQEAANAAKATSEAVVKALEEQVRETQRTLNLHMDRLAGVEARLEEHDGVKMDVSMMRSQVEESRRELAEALRLRSAATKSLSNGRVPVKSEADEGDFDDGASVASVETVMQGETNPDAKLGNGPMGVDEIESVEVSRRLSKYDEDSLDDAETLQRLKNHIGPRAPPDGVPAPFGKEEDSDVASRKNEELSKRLEAIESQLERALELGKTLAGQHAEATEVVRRLEEKVKVLETEQSGRALPTTEESSSASSDGITALEAGGAAAVASGSILAVVEAKWGKWREAFEVEFEKEKGDLRAEREEVKRVVKMWDSLNTEVEDVLDKESVVEEEGEAGSASVLDGTSDTLQPVTQPGFASKKRRRRRAAAAAAAAAATSGQAPSVGSVGLAASASSAASSSSSSSIDHNISRINRELRSLLYTEDFNSLVKEATSPSSSAAAGVSSSSSSSSTSNQGMADRDATPTQSDAGNGDGQEEISSSKGSVAGGDEFYMNVSDMPGYRPGMRPNELRALRDLKRQQQQRKGGSSGGGALRNTGKDGTAMLPTLTVAGVFVFGMTAWVLSGGKVIHLSGAPGGM